MVSRPTYTNTVHYLVDKDLNVGRIHNLLLIVKEETKHDINPPFDNCTGKLTFYDVDFNEIPQLSNNGWRLEIKYIRDGNGYYPGSRINIIFFDQQSLKVEENVGPANFDTFIFYYKKFLDLSK